MSKLLEILEQKGIKQTYLAWKLGVSNGAVSNWCTDRAIPRTETAIKIAKILDVSIDDIWGKEKI